MFDSPGGQRREGFLTGIRSVFDVCGQAAIETAPNGAKLDSPGRFSPGLSIPGDIAKPQRGERPWRLRCLAVWNLAPLGLDHSAQRRPRANAGLSNPAPVGA